MLWSNPWAWAGLIALGIPIAIHLVGRPRARVVRFPTLRFLDKAPTSVSRRSRLTELPLLLVRLAILLAAVTALAGPVIARGHVAGEPDVIARAILVDTSASMQRRAGSVVATERLVDAARQESIRAQSDAATSVVIESAVPDGMVVGASDWLLGREGKKELIIVSDFQLGTIDSATLARVPPAIAVRLIDVQSPADTLVRVSRSTTELTTSAQATVDANGTRAEWRRSAGARPVQNGPLLLTAPADAGRASAALRAARQLVGQSSRDSSQAIAVVYPGSPARATLRGGASTLRDRDAVELVIALRRDSLIANAATHATGGTDAVVTVGSSAKNDSLIVVATNSAGVPVIAAAHAMWNGSPYLVLFCDADPGSLLSASLLAAVERIGARALDVRELEPSVIPRATLTTWERPDVLADLSSPRDGTWVGRWLWAVVLILLAIEQVVRRGRTSQRVEPEIAIARAA